jgi:hypothetical protein
LARAFRDAIVTGCVQSRVLRARPSLPGPYSNRPQALPVAPHVAGPAFFFVVQGVCLKDVEPDLQSRSGQRSLHPERQSVSIAAGTVGIPHLAGIEVTP